MTLRPVVVLLLVWAAPVSAVAQVDCSQPRPRDTAPLLKAIQEDDAMASTFEFTAGACVNESAACDAQKLKCGEQLTTTLRSQVNVDNGMWLRDMLIPFHDQRYPLVAQISTVEVAQDVSCNADSATLKAAATRRRQLAQRRRDLVNEYPKWAMWAASVAQKCRADAAAAAKAQGEAAATAKAQADAAALAKKAEEDRQANVKKAQATEKEKAEADKKAKEDAAKAETERQRKAQDAQAEMLRLQAQAQAERERREREAKMSEAERAAEEKRRQEEEKKRAAEEAERKRLAEEEHKKREAEAAADAKLVAEREARKDAAEKKAYELREQEEARRLAAEKQIAQIEGVDRSDERLNGSMAAQLQGGYMSITNTDGGFMLGLNVQLRYGIWMTAPAHGMSSGFEMQVHGSFFGLVAGQGGAQYFSATPDLRWFFARVGVGASFEWRHLLTPLPTTDPLDTYALGINAAFAVFDNPNSRFIITLRWLPFLNAGTAFAPERLTADFDIGYKWFSASLQAGTITLRNSAAATTTIGWYAGVGLGGRFRF